MLTVGRERNRYWEHRLIVVFVDRAALLLGWPAFAFVVCMSRRPAYREPWLLP